MKIRDDVNEYDTPVTVFWCETCGREFTVCPAVHDSRLDNWKGCMDPACESYDPNRDVDKMLEEGKVCIEERIDH